MAQNHGRQQIQTDLITKISLKGKHLWDVVTLCFSLCLTQAYLTLKSSLSSVLTLLLLASTLLLHPITSYGVQIDKTSSKTYQQSDYPETISIHLCNCKGNGLNTMRQFAVSTQAEEEQTRLLLRIYPKRTASSICMRCVHTETATRIIPCLTSLEDARSMELQNWLSRQTLEMES